MIRWEYREWDGDEEDFLDALNTMGDYGWEMIERWHDRENGRSIVRALLKRVVQPRTIERRHIINVPIIERAEGST